MTSRQAEEAERDRIRDYYESRRNRSWSGAGYVVEERRALLRRAALEVAGLDLATAQILDVGCGDGGDLAFWSDEGVAEDRLFGTEIQPARAAAASARLPSATIVPVAGFTLPFDDGAFKLTTASMVLSSILDDGARKRLFDEMLRVTGSGGVVAVYDFRVRKPGNRSVVAMTPRRARALSRSADFVWPAAPFLPLLPMVLRLPTFLRAPLVRLLPRTHVLYLWRQ